MRCHAKGPTRTKPDNSTACMPVHSIKVAVFPKAALVFLTRKALIETPLSQRKHHFHQHAKAPTSSFAAAPSDKEQAAHLQPLKQGARQPLPGRLLTHNSRGQLQVIARQHAAPPFEQCRPAGGFQCLQPAPHQQPQPQPQHRSCIALHGEAGWTFTA